MHQSIARRPLVASLALSLTLGWGAYAVAQELQDGDHRALGGYLKSYLAPEAKQKDKDKAKEDLVKTLDKIGKKRIDNGDGVQAALALTADLGRAIAMSTDYKSAAAGKVTQQPLDVGEKKKLEYSLWVPSAYKVNTPTPLILCIPGANNGKASPTAEFLQKYWLEKEGRDGTLIAVVPMPETPATWAQMDGGVRMVMLTFGDVTNRFNIDRDRIYLLGRGEGVGAALTIASMFPQRFAGVVGTAGDAGKVATTNFQNLPTFFQGAGADATAFETKNKELGYNNVTINAAATVPEMWQWMQAHPRVANPAKVTLAPGSPVPNKAYWVEIQPTEGQGLMLTAEADRATNTVTIKTTGIPWVRVFLNDVLVDLSKPVKVVLNGREQTDVIPRSIDDFLELVERRTCDSGMVYVARKAYDLPE